MAKKFKRLRRWLNDQYITFKVTVVKAYGEIFGSSSAAVIVEDESGVLKCLAAYAIKGPQPEGLSGA